MNSFKLILRALVVLILVSCGGGTAEPISSPQTSQSQSPIPSPTTSESLASPTPVKGDTAYPSPTPVERDTAYPSPTPVEGNAAYPSPTPKRGEAKVQVQAEEQKQTKTGPQIQTIYEFAGNGDGSTTLFDVKAGDLVLINYTGGPITVYWAEPGDSPRQIYNGPSSTKGRYDTSVGENGSFSINIKCDGDCEWIVAIESDGVAVTNADTVVSQSPKKDEPDSKDQSQQQDSDKTANVTNSSILNTLIVKEEWDVLSQSGAAVILSAPDTRAINLDYNAGSRMASIIGAKNAVPANANVMVANLELGTFVLAEASENGTFEAEIDGQPGTHILIKQDATKEIFNVEDPGSTHGPNTLRTIFPPGVFMRIPTDDSGSGISFSSAGRLPSDEDAPWTISGDMGSNEFSPGEEVAISGQIAIRTDEANEPSSAQLSFDAHLLINANGRQVGGAKVFATTLFTATDLPIESKGLLGHDYSLGSTQLDWRFEDGLWISDFSTTLTVDKTSRTGLFQLKAGLSGVAGLPRQGTPNILHRSFLQKASIGTFSVGQPASMNFTSTLLADEMSEGSRGGVIAREDQGFFDLSHRAGVRHQPVVSRLDNYGRPWGYSLEPYVPMLGVVDRAPTAAPSIELDFSNSSLTVTVSRPDGKIDTLGPTSLARYTIKSPRTPWHVTVSEGGGNLGEIPQLQADGDQFKYEFPMDGDYVVNLNGEISDIHGRTYTILGTYDVAVANVLDIETSLLPGTPFEIGDSMPVGLRIMPGVPAAIDYKVQLIGADGKITNSTFSGNANQNGWWDGGGDYFQFNKDGEYRVDVEARYTDDDTNLWIGRLTFGSAVATADGPMILHGRRGPNRLTEVPPVWGFVEDFANSNGDHIQMPYFSGDVMWGQNSGHMKNSVVLLTSLQILDENNALISRVKDQIGGEGHDGIPRDDLIMAGQLPFSTTVDPGTVSKNEDIDLWAYSYVSVQRPGIRVREHILGDDLGGTYWRFDDAYHMQSGNGRQGDLPGDFKFMYAASTIRDDALDQGVYAAYASGWVMAHEDDPMGARFMPPFQGAAGGPDGGSLFTVHGREIDMFLLPLGVQPGAILEMGDYFQMAGPIMPTLPSYVEYTVTAPDGTTRDFEGRANTVGYFYQPDDDFVLDQSGIWRVNLKVTHDGMTSAGPVEAPYPNGGLLSPDGSTFRFTVKGPDTQSLLIETDLSQLTPAEWFANVRNANFQAELPSGWNGDKATVIVTMPGVVLVDEDISVQGNKIEWDLDAQALNNLANNFDYEEGIADTITVTFHAESEANGVSSEVVGTIVTHGARVPAVPNFDIALSELPELSSFEINKTDQFVVDLEHVVGGHPFKGMGTKDPDNGAHVNWDNSNNEWPYGTAVSDFPAFYAVSDGYVDRIETYETVGGNKHKYSVNIIFAQKDGVPVKFHISIEPSMSPGDSSFYEPFIVVEEGESVYKGQVIAYMYLAPDGNFPGPHIHFSVQPNGESQQTPAIFTEQIVQDFHEKWGIFGMDRGQSHSPDDVAMPACMGYKLEGSENPFSSDATECLK